MKKITLALVASILLLIPCKGQNLDLKLEEDYLVIENSGKYSLSYLSPEQFQQLDWQPGFAYYLDGSSRKFDGMKYDPEQDIIQVSASGNVLTLLPGVVNGVSMESGAVVNRIFVKVPLNKPVFMEALSAGKIHLLMYRMVKTEKEDMYKATDETKIVIERQPDEPVEFEEVLYVWNRDEVKKFKSSKKAALKLMSDKEEEMERYLDENNFRFRQVDDLMKVFDYYNSL